MEPDKLLVKQWWLVEIAIVLSIISILSFALKKVIRVVKSRVSKKEGYWKKKVHRIIHVPLQAAIWGFGIAYAADVLVIHFGWAGFAKYTGPLRGAFIVACLGWLALRWLKDVFVHLSDKSHVYGVSKGTFFAVNKLCSVLVVLITTMIVLQIFGIGIAPLLAFGGIGVAGLAFAAKDIIANFFGGAMLHFTGIISVDDEVVIPSQSDFMGIVTDIGWYITRFEDYYRRPVYFPNATFTSHQVINESRRSHRRIKETITIDYDSYSNLEAIIEDLREKVAAHPEVDQTQSFSISFFQYGDYGLQIFIYILVYKMGYIKFLQTKQEIFLIVGEVVAKHGAEFTYPTTNVNLKQVPIKE